MCNKNTFHLVIGISLVVSLLLLFSCGASLGNYSTCAETQTQLNRNNFKVVQTGVQGYAECWYLLSTIPLGDMELFKTAMAMLKTKANTVGKSTAIVNVTQDISVQSYIVVSKKYLTLTGDVIEFVDK
jgi:hypothetical protein